MILFITTAVKTSNPTYYDPDLQKMVMLTSDGAPVAFGKKME
jgi:hypothetical protein